MNQRRTTTSFNRRAQITPVMFLAVLSLALSALLNGCIIQPIGSDVFSPTLAPPAIDPTSQPPSTSSPFMLLFTDPYAPDAKNQTGGPDEAIVAAIDGAQKTIDIAIYNFSLKNVADALLRAQDRGVVIRMVMESDSIDGPMPQFLMENDIPILGDRKESLMHNKFIVIDGLEVWLGSLNLTGAGTYKDHNHIMRLRSSRIAQNYTNEFEEMFINDQFGAGSPANTPFPQVTLDGRTLEVFYSPDDGVAKQLVALIESAQQSVHFLAYSFTADDIGSAMLARAVQGVQVRGVFEYAQVKSNKGTEWDRLRDAGLDVVMDGISGQMHHKVIVIDRKIVSLGSYNFSANAEKRNDENVMIIHDAQLAEQFLAEFERIYARGKLE
jgi:phosphatidylserine/phosphatidylglycerophosphate/cardiolipin synthase-like enzyme